MNSPLYIGQTLVVAAFIMLAVFQIERANAKSDTVIRVQTALPTNADEQVMLSDFAANVERLTAGSVKFEFMPAGAMAKPFEILDAVDSGEVEAGFAWTHYWTEYHPAALLFGSPLAGAAVGLDNIAFLSWYLHGGGRALYERLWEEMGVNVKGFILQPVGPEALGWFREPLRDMDDFKSKRFRVPPGLAGQAYTEMGVRGLPIAGGEIFEALKNGLIDSAEWCCPKPDRVFGIHKELKHYYLEGLHQVVVNADLYINGDTWGLLSAEQQAAIEVAADASLIRSISYRIRENGIALKSLVEEDGVILHDTPSEYFTQFMDTANRILRRNAGNNAFFKEVWESQINFAKTAVPYWSRAQSTNAKLGRAASGDK